MPPTFSALVRRFAFFSLFVSATLITSANARAQNAAKDTTPTAEPTFNCLGLYWKPAGGSATRPVTVAYRVVGENDFREALPLWFDATKHKDEGTKHSNEYRGSIVNLKPNTEYEVRLTLKDAAPVTLRTKTWNDNFKIAKTVTLPATTSDTYTIKDGGSAETGYVLYEAPKGSVWDAANKIQDNLKVDASYVIVRGLTLKGAINNGIVLGDVHHVVIERCDISGWGTNAADGWGKNLQAAVYSNSKKLRNIVIQNNELHHPRSDSNSWNEVRTLSGGRVSKHPNGPQGIVFKSSVGFHVIRFNRIYSDMQHMFNDGMGETHNFSFDGFPGRDSDVHDNFVSHCWDDGLEIEGADMNVRVWNNYIDMSYGAIGAASPSLGPLYIFRNVYAMSRKDEQSNDNARRGHYIVKLGNEKPEWTQGRMYIFHNTTLQPPPFADGGKYTSGAQSGMVLTSDSKTAGNIMSRNNLLHMRGPNDLVVNDPPSTPTNDWNYDMYNGRIKAKEGSQSHAIKAAPTYDRSPDGRLWLRPGTPGHDAAVRLPNFNDDFVGKAPDMGAVETGTQQPRPALWPEFPPPPPPATAPASAPAEQKAENLND